jgi:hypothetical protein
MKTLLTVGDSFTFGEELSNEMDSYPQLLADKFKLDLVNLAKPGSGNKRMVRSVVEYVSQGNKPDLVIIGWSSPGRIEFADEHGVHYIWPGYRGTMYAENQPWRLELLDYINKHHNSENLYQNYLLDVILMQGFLKQHDINYVMITTCANEYYHNVFYSKMEVLCKLIDSTHYLGWPTEGMAEWTRGCRRGPRDHFLADGHKKVAEKLYEHIRNFGWLS